LILRGSQVSFLSTYYPDSQKSSSATIDTLMWLYDMAEYREETLIKAKDPIA
jgi:hypothetical protein